ncbi:MAG: hypothetical protein IK136_01035 [Oscillospiraceae bacterium]|nr:hypothetical protein [Oscillospiraceae bacterium]
MKKKLRVAALIMLLIAAAFVILAFVTMDVPIDPPLPLNILRVVCKIYPCVMIGLFLLSFFVKDNE